MSEYNMITRTLIPSNDNATSYDSTDLAICELELKSKSPRQNRYPSFERICRLTAGFWAKRLAKLPSRSTPALR
jgi:hypothetical protein